MDPVSVTASIISITDFACKSCQALLSFFRGISKAKKDILKFCRTLQSLDSTLQCIRSLCVNPDIQPHLTENLKLGLDECLSVLEAANKKCQKAQNLLREGRMQSSWARIRWYASAEHWLDDFFVHIQTYHMVFSLELSALQT